MSKTSCIIWEATAPGYPRSMVLFKTVLNLLLDVEWSRCIWYAPPIASLVQGQVAHHFFSPSSQDMQKDFQLLQPAPVCLRLQCSSHAYMWH